MLRAVERILLAVQNNEHIVVYTDYDCDGIPGGVVLHDFFEAITFTNFENYIPHRHHEGYGFNPDSVEAFAKRNAKLIITVDCGIVDVEATKRANNHGIDVIITDHHEPGGTLPPAYAIINPKRDDKYPFKGLCGTGVAYKLVQALIKTGRERSQIALKDGWEKWWLDMVGLATIADMVPLVGENRVLAHYGLRVLRKSRRPGLQHLLRSAGGDQRYLTEDDIGFTIGPRINAASRMDDPEDAFHMLCTRDEGEAGERVRHLEKLNNERKGVVASMTKEVKKRIKGFSTFPNVIVMGNPEWRPSLVGLVAGSLAEEYRRPVFLWGRDGRGILKGSCRSDGLVSTLALMEASPGAFIEFGGHHMSGGFSVDDQAIHALHDALQDAYASVSGRSFGEFHEQSVDADAALEDLDDAFMRMLDSLAPFGEANPKPLFRFKDITPTQVETFGKTKNHTRLLFETRNGNREAIAFFKTPEQFAIVPTREKQLTLIAHVERSYFRGRRQTRLRIVDIV
jgi:single-stranded-DNA-specific exonuclease